jgi:hypothetical protein
MRIASVVGPKNLAPESIDLFEAVVQLLTADINDELAAMNRSHESTADLVPFQDNRVGTRLRKAVSSSESCRTRTQDDRVHVLGLHVVISLAVDLTR